MSFVVRISESAHTIVALGVAYEETFTRYVYSMCWCCLDWYLKLRSLASRLPGDEAGSNGCLRKSDCRRPTRLF